MHLFPLDSECVEHYILALGEKRPSTPESVGPMHAMRRRCSVLSPAATKFAFPFSTGRILVNRKEKRESVLD